MRIILDTNVVMSALLWRGTPYRLLEAIQHRPSLQLFSSTALLEDFTGILTRRAATQRLAMIG
jgi:predicted nucleic acid-binding protein